MVRFIIFSCRPQLFQAQSNFSKFENRTRENYMTHPGSSFYRWDEPLWRLIWNSFLFVCSGILLLLHVSCSSQLYWAKPGAEPGDFDRDVVECRRSLAGGSGGRGALNPVIGIPQSEVELCLSKKGWFLAEKPADVKAAAPPN